MRYPWPFTRLDQIWAALQDQSLDEHLNGIGIAVGVLGVDYDITMSAMCQQPTSPLAPYKLLLKSSLSSTASHRAKIRNV